MKSIAASPTLSYFSFLLSNTKNTAVKPTDSMYLQNNRLQVLVLHVNHFIWTVTDYSFTALDFLRLQLGATTAQVQSKCDQMLTKSENVKETLNKIRASDTSARYIFNRAKVYDGQSSLVVFGHPMVLESFNVCLVSLSCYSVTPPP